ncbi:hypothetical protein GQ44DRAFT_5277 [Phaeosphaeriaceae sp. PMI808]|nr:hypothetical protein GQ44DRAFT_5277 [Phaeosphaeriaceae sp. PMI808]
MISFSLHRGATYLTFLSLSSTVLAGGYNPEPPKVSSCTTATEILTRTTSTVVTVTASAKFVTTTVGQPKKRYHERGYQEYGLVYNASTPAVSVPPPYYHTPTPTHGTPINIKCPTLTSTTAVTSTSVLTFQPLITVTELYSGPIKPPPGTSVAPPPLQKESSLLLPPPTTSTKAVVVPAPIVATSELIPSPTSLVSLPTRPPSLELPPVNNPLPPAIPQPPVFSQPAVNTPPAVVPVPEVPQPAVTP